MFINTSRKVVYPDKFKPGDVAMAKKFVRFCDGTCHKVGQEILVTEDSKSYFNVMHGDYDKKEEAF